MARTAVNPEVLSTPSPQGLPLISMAAVDSKTWKKGEIGFMTSGEVEILAATGKTNVYCIFAETQSTSTSSSSVWVRRLVPGTRLSMFVMTNGVAATAATAVVGTAYGVEGLSNVSYLDTGTASGQFKVIRMMSDASDLDDNRSDMDAAPGKVEVEFMGYVT